MIKPHKKITNILTKIKIEFRKYEILYKNSLSMILK